MKIIDLGSVKIIGISELKSLVVMAVNAGTLGYTAPEVIIDKRVSREANRFSLGVIAYEMFMGNYPTIINLVQI